jgi:LPXTG-motif cell wall-anchored protein
LKSSILKVLKILVFVAFGIGLIFLFISKLSEEDKAEIITAIKNANYSWIVFSMFLGTLSHLSRALRWRQLLGAIGYQTRVISTFFAIMIMYFANLAVPRLGEVSRCAILKRYENIPIEKSFGTVIAERALDLVFLGITFAITCLLQFDKILEGLDAINVLKPAKGETNYTLPILAGIGLIGAALLFFLRKHPALQKVYAKIKNLVLGFYQGLKSAFKVKNPWLFIAHSVFIWFMYLAMVWVSFPAITELKELGALAGLSCLVFGSVGIILVPGGIGIYPLIIAQILMLYGIDQIYGYAFGWVLWIGQTGMLLFWGLVSVILLPILVKKVDSNGLNTSEELHTGATS